MVKRSGAQILADRIATLSQDDAAAVAKWRSEIGEERASAILKAVAGISSDGRPTELQNRWPLLLMMGVEIRQSGCSPHAAAQTVQRTADRSRLAINPTDDSLVKWLTRSWGKYSQAVFKELDARPRRIQINAMAAFRQMTEVLEQASMFRPSPELLRSLGIVNYMNREPFPGYTLLMEASKRDPIMRFLRQARINHGQDEGT